MKLHQYRSLWGLENQDWEATFLMLKEQGFQGIEASLGDIKYKLDNGARFVSLLQAHDLKWICGVYTGWDDYEGPWQRKSVAEHLEQYEKQLQAAFSLPVTPIHVNVHSGADDFTREEAIEFFEKALALERTYSHLNVSISHETHRGRILYSPWVARDLFARFPELTITLDLSHWVVVAERLFDCPEHFEFLSKIVVPRVRHVHARIGTAQAPQISSLSTEKFTDEISHFEQVWELVRKSLQDNHQSSWTMTPEYGPYPYQPESSQEDLNDMISRERLRLAQLFV